MLSGVLGAIQRPTRPALWLFTCCIWLCLGTACGKLIGDVEVLPLRDEPADAATGIGAVQPTPARTACRAGTVQCQGPMLQVCERDGSGWQPVQRCASAALCSAGAGDQSRCVEPSCEPGLTCDGADLLQCNAERNGFDRIQTCESAAHCDAMSGACDDARCTPGEVTCNGPTLQRCNDGPTGHDELATCASAALCDDLVRATCGGDRFGCDLSSAVCPAPSCSPGELRCTGARLEQCNAGLNGWSFVDECVTVGICELTRQSPAALSCLEPLCDVGDVICSAEGARLACNAERTQYSISISQCRSADQCTPQGCQADACSVGELSCNGSTLQECQAGPGGVPIRVAVDECATRQLCDLTLGRPATSPPSCTPPACAAGGLDCAGRQLQVCNAGRTDFVNRELCATDALCRVGLGTGACPLPCSGGACNGSMLRSCNAELTSLVDTEDCGSAAKCDAVQGRCADPCVPGALRCNGAAIERCQSPLQGWQRLQTCETAGLCQASVQQQQTSCSARRCNPGDHRCTGQRLEVCNAELTDFVLSTTCAAGQICDAQNQQCDICAPDASSCTGNRFSHCSSNGQAISTRECGAGLCSASGRNTGCLECATPGGFRCDNQGSLLVCSLDQQREDQLDTCRTPQLCRQNLGRCLECDPPGSSRCDGAQVLGCSPQNTESVLRECDSAALCRQVGATASCDESQCAPGSRQCTQQGEVLICNPARTGFVAQATRVFCATPALCDVTAPGGCDLPACQSGQRRCAGGVVEVCNEARTNFRAEETCNAAGGFSCRQSGAAASCACAPGEYRCLPGQGLSRCDAGGIAFSPIGRDFDCEGATRLSCNGASLSSESCSDAAHCQASTTASCASCVAAGECSNGSFCDGVEACVGGRCSSSGSPCGGLICSEVADACAQCFVDADCSTGQTCADGVCVEAVDGGT